VKALNFILIGHPVAHSMSPAIHGAVYRRHGLPHAYEAVDCPSEQDVLRQIDRVRRGEIAGANVTVPWKRFALASADRADATAADTGAANVLLRADDGAVVAHNTDVAALAERLAAGKAQGDAAVVLGNGGAALAAVAACRAAGATSVTVSARSWIDEADPSSWRGRADFDRLGAELATWSRAESSRLSNALRSAAVVVQSTSAGMVGAGGGQELADMIPWKRLRSDAFLYDVVYNPPITPFLERARSLGLKGEGGLSMLVGQAALAVRLWLGIAAPRAEMTAAAERLLFGMSS